MYRACIAVVDASRARLFTFERSSEAEGLTDQLTEQRDLVNPVRRKRPSEMFTDSQSSSRTGGLQYDLDDHRDAHVDAIDSEFSRAVVGELAQLMRSTHTHRLIVAASPRMLGELRVFGRELSRDATEIVELPRNLVKLSPAELRDQLASYGLLPDRVRRGLA